MLSTRDHSLPRQAGVAVYSVVSRRSGGISVGIDLNPNHECNWACAYCQVEGLKRGGAPDLDVTPLEALLDAELEKVTSAAFLEAEVEPHFRHVTQVAFSGNGEPTTSHGFAQAVELARGVLERRGLHVPLVLITNGSLLGSQQVQQAVARLGQVGEVWFKFDRATKEGLLEVNGVSMSVEAHRQRLLDCARLAPTWIQTCAYALDGQPMKPAERAAWLQLVNGVAKEVSLRGVKLYGLARQSQQPLAPRLSAVDPSWLEALAAEVVGLPVEVRV